MRVKAGEEMLAEEEALFYAIRFDFSILFNILKKSQCSLEIYMVRILKGKL